MYKIRFFGYSDCNLTRSPKKTSKSVKTNKSMKFCNVLLALLCVFVQSVWALNNNELLKLQNKNSNKIIKLTSSNYEKILGGPSDSYIVLLLTATNPEIGCVLCNGLTPEYQKMVNSWVKDHPNGDNLFFARADFADGHTDIFKRFQLNSVPKLFFYSPSDDQRDITTSFKPLNFPHDQSQFAGYVSNMISQATKIPFQIYEEVNYGSAIITFFFVFLIVIGIRKNTRKVVAIITRRELWGFLTVLSILLFVNGYMYNAIRGTPYARVGADGSVSYFAPGQQQQVGAETQIMTFIYSILAFSVVSLITKATSISDDKVHLGVIGALLGVILVFYSILMSIFQFKSGGYPYHLLNVWSPS